MKDVNHDELGAPQEPTGDAAQDLGQVSGQVSVQDSVQGGGDPTGERSLESLVGAWLPVPDIADRCGVPLSTVRRWLDERDLVAARVGERRIRSVPEAFLDEHGPIPALKGTFTVLGDSGMDDAETLAWLFTPDPTLPGGDTPVAAIRAGFKTEVRRRAMEEAL